MQAIVFFCWRFSQQVSYCTETGRKVSYNQSPTVIPDCFMEVWCQLEGVGGVGEEGHRRGESPAVVLYHTETRSEVLGKI